MRAEDKMHITGGDRFTMTPLSQTRSTSTRNLVDSTHVTLRKWEELEAPVKQNKRTALLLDLNGRAEYHQARIELDQRTSERAKRKPQASLEALGEMGFAWRDVAALLHVSVGAVNKWRRGDGITGPNRLKLAKLLALLDMLEVQMVSEPPSWIEMPIHNDVSVSPLDMLIADRYDLVLELAGHATGAGDYQTVLDEFDPGWRDRLIDKSFETFVDSDGVVAIRPRAAN